MRLHGVVGVVLLVCTLSSSLGLAEQGPFADEIVFDVRMTEEIAIQDVAAGNTDIFQWGTPANVIHGLTQAALGQLELYVVPSESSSLLFNPYPDAAPYIAVATSGQEFFNPYAIRDVRFAMHFLLNRQQVVDQILRGSGSPSSISVDAAEPGAYKLYLEAARLGLTAEGDEARAIEMVTAAMEAAAQLPQNAGRLSRTWSGVWTFDGAPITLNFLIRADDPNVRLPLGRYFADQVKKCGFVVNRVEHNRAYCVSTCYQTNPADYLWNIYTEGWSAGGTSQYPDDEIAYMYAPWGANMPGGGQAWWWNYQNPDLDAWTQAAAEGSFATLDEYWNLMARSARQALREAVRVYVMHQYSYFAANRGAFESRFVYGLVDGINSFSLYSMMPVNKDRPVRVTQFSSIGSLFVSAWDPAGTQGFDDYYATNIIQNCTDPMWANAPGTGAYTPILARWSNVNVQVDFSTGAPMGQIAVPSAAVRWDSARGGWVSAGGERAWAEADYSFHFPRFHDGSEFSLLDFAAAEGFATDWATEDYAGDPRYDSAYSAAVTPSLGAHGAIYDFQRGTIHAYFDSNFPGDYDRVGASGAPRLYARAVDHGQGVKWTVVEALGRIVASCTSNSGTVYSFSRLPGVVEVDVLNPSCVWDIRYELDRMRDEKFVPQYLAPLLGVAGLTTDDVARMYQQAIDFIDSYGHAYIGNGGYIITRVDSANSQMTLRANRDSSYPFSGQYWLETMAWNVSIARIDRVDPPLVAQAGRDATVEIRVSQAQYPYNDYAPATDTNVQLIFVGPSEVAVTAYLVEPGVYQAVIPGYATGGIASGEYRIEVIAGVVPAWKACWSSTLQVR